MKTLRVDLGDRSYPIFIGSNLLCNRELVLPYLGNGRVVVVSNELVAPLYIDRIRRLVGDVGFTSVILQDGEQFKTLDSVNQIYDHLIMGKYDRNTTLVALGGGVVGDITGFAAATYPVSYTHLTLPTIYSV